MHHYFSEILQMKYRLGLDLGVGSIGSAVIGLDEQNNPQNIIDAGVRIFEVSEGAEDRRLKRTARKNLTRTRKRLELLAQKLHENNLWINTSPEGSDNLKSKSPYKIRHDALYKKLSSPNYIGRAILHLAKHRGAGFVSAAEEFTEEILDIDERPKKKLSAYDMMLKHLKDTGSQTIGEFFYKRLQDKDHRIIRQHEYALSSNIVDYAIPRYLVKDEFNKIWDTQACYFPQMQKTGLKQEIYDILFYERPPAPYAVGKCIYFRDENRLLKAHPLSEMRRIYEETNNIRILDDLGTRRLTLPERDKIINELLLKGQNAGKQSVKKLLNLPAQQKISLPEDKTIKAYLYSRPEFAQIEYIKNLSAENLASFAEFLAEPTDPADKNGRLYSEDKLIAKLKPLLKINDDKEIGDLLTKLPKGRCMLGLSATKVILAKLREDVKSHREITDNLAKSDPRFTAEEEFARQTQGKFASLPYYGKILQTDTQPIPPLVLAHAVSINPDEKNWGKIANPAVHMILNQLRLVVNEIIKIYGQPYDINIEVGRDVGLSTKKKKQLEQRQRANERLNEKAKQYLREHKLSVNRTNILKYKLAEEQGWTDAYDPRIKISQNFSGMEIDHMCPQADKGSDTYNNLCLVDRNSNLPKGDKFPYEWLAIKYKDNPEIIREILKNARNRTPDKAWRFEPDAREHFEDYGDAEATNRYLTDTRYVAKMACRYLRAIVNCDDSDEVIHSRILAVKGAQTAKLRRAWNLLGLEYDLMGLDIPRYISCPPYWLEINTGEIISGTAKPDIDGQWKFFNKAKNKEWQAKPRIDHRHHAMDAITIACINRSLVQQLAHGEYPEHIIPLPLTGIASVGEFRQTVLNCLKDIKVSHKPNHSKSGQLHKETGRIVLCTNPENSNNMITVYRRKILQVVKSFKDLSKLLIPETIKNEWHPDIASDKQKQAELVKNFELYINTAEQILIAENEAGIAEGKKEIKITEGRIIAKAFYIIREKGLWQGDKFKCYENNSSLIYIPKHGLAYEGRNNHCVDFYQKYGKVGWEIIKRFDANQPDFRPQWQKEGAKIIWSVQQGDLIEINTPDEWQIYTDKKRCIARIKKFSEGRLSIDYFTDARMTSPQDKNLKYMFVDTLKERGLSFFTKNQARKIELTPFGKVKKKHKVLWHGQKTTA